MFAVNSIFCDVAESAHARGCIGIFRTFLAAEHRLDHLEPNSDR